MNAFARTVTAVVAPLLGLSVLAAAPSSSAAAPTAPALTSVTLAGTSTAARPSAVAASLDVAPHTYVGGQQLTWTGDLGIDGVRTIHLQRHMNRAGDSWDDVEGSTRLTNADGTFRFNFLAPAMFNIKFRVVGGGQVTPALLFNARSQDLTLAAPSQAAVGRPFSMTVDTAPTLSRRPDLPGPVLAGRSLTLQQQVLTPESMRGYVSAWRDVASTTTDGAGMGRFSVTPQQTGATVYRVRQESWTEGGSRIGWFPSFPSRVQVLPAGSRVSEAPAPVEGVATTAPSAAARTALPTVVHAAGTNSSSTFGWGVSLFDFGWAYGESLSTPPSRGSRIQGRWLDVTNGTGRVSLHNGAMALDSQRDNVDGPGDIGTTRATLRGNASTYGRWEVRLRMKSTENNARDYRTKVQLIPEDPDAFDCGARTITIADLSTHTPGFGFGARSAVANRRWHGVRHDVRFPDQTHHFGVEVAQSHISWFLDGKVIGTVKNSAAVSDVPMTLRISMVGKGRAEMNRTEAIADWVRGFRIDTGRQMTNGKALHSTRYAGGC